MSDAPRNSQLTSAVYDAYLVDLDGTLYRAKPLRWLMAAELALFGLPQLAIIRAFRREHERLRLEEGPSCDSPYILQLRNTAQALNLPIERVEATVLEWMQHRPTKWIRRCIRTDLLAELRHFQAAGGRLALVSDYPAVHKLRALESRVVFDTVVANGEQGGPRWLKPHPDGYIKAAKVLGVSPHKCLVIGDREDADGRAARAAGMDFRLIR